ncbi:hypothetical protein OH77DRAFT_1423780 [Trametes cingulata]|nr:hypothetical protein OH77DRAFT_1423780 [Trametes cingulata]
MTSTAWANPYYLHPWFKMPSLKRKELSSDEEDAPTTTTPVRAASYAPRRSLSPTPSPKRRRCDVLESGMSQLTLDGRPIPPSSVHFAPGQFPPPPTLQTSGSSGGAPTVFFPDTPTAASQPAAPLWADGPHVPNVTHLPTTTATSVVRPGSVEEPTSPESVEQEADAPEVSMKVPSWYEIEKDRIVITDLEDSDAEDNDTTPGAGGKSALAVDLDDSDAPQFTISSALLDRLPKPPTAFGPLAPESNPSNALVLYRPLPLPAESKEDEDSSQRTREDEDDGPRIEEVEQDVPVEMDVGEPMDDQIQFTPIVESVGEPADEPMDIEML